MKLSKMKMAVLSIVLVAALSVGLYAGAAHTDIPEIAVPMANSPVSAVLVPKADGKVVHTKNGATIDASNAADGYIMIKCAADAKLKVIITGSNGKEAYTYNLNNAGNYEVFPLSDGNGAYKVGVYKNTTGTKYATLLSKTIDVSLKNEFAPFLLPNQYVNYSANSKAVATAAEIVKGKATELEKVAAVYEYVIGTLTYDTDKAASVQSGYLPDIDKVLEAKKGICFDYASVMAAMLRSQGVPTKLVVGFAGTAYHAWINVYSAEKGWVEGVVLFDGTTWKLMDPTFASSGNSSAKTMEFIGDGKNYKTKYLY